LRFGDHLAVSAVRQRGSRPLAQAPRKADSIV